MGILEDGTQFEIRVQKISGNRVRILLKADNKIRFVRARDSA